MSDLIRLIFLPFFAVAQLIFEVLLAVGTYTYLNIFHVGIFGSLVVFAGDVLNIITNYMRYFFPDSAAQVYATTLGDLNPKAMLLLLIGLTVSGFMRLIFWTIKALSHKKT